MRLNDAQLRWRKLSGLISNINLLLGSAKRLNPQSLELIVKCRRHQTLHPKNHVTHQRYNQHRTEDYQPPIEAVRTLHSAKLGPVQ